jgi:hypothetical protein
VIAAPSPRVIIPRSSRHVLAAAVCSGAALIVTANVKDFPTNTLEPFGIEAIHPDNFLLDQLDLDRQRVLDGLARLVARNRHAPQTVSEPLSAISPLVPRFAAAARSRADTEPESLT